MAEPPRRPLTISSDPVRIGYAPSAGHWYSIAQALNWLHGDGGCCLPFCALDLTITNGSTSTHPVALRSRPATTQRLWMVYVESQVAPVQEAEFTDLSGTTHTFQVASATIGRHLLYFLEDCGAQDASMAVQTGTISFEAITGGTLHVRGVSCYDLARPALDEDYPDMGVSPPVGANSLADREGESSGGLAESVGYARRHAARLGLFTWIGDESSPVTVASGSSPFSTFATLMPRRVGDSTTTTIQVHVRAQLATAGSATLQAQTSEAGDSDTTSVTSTSWAWYTLTLSAENEDSTANADAGARSNAPFGDLLDVGNAGGGPDLEFAAVIVTESPVDALDMWTPQRLGEDDVELWLDAEHLCEVTSGDVSAWACPITGRTATVNGSPAFDGPDAGYGNRSVVDFDDATPDYLTFSGGSHFDATADGLTVYMVCEWDDASSFNDYILSHLSSSPAGGWAIVSDSGGSGIFGLAIDGGGTTRTVVEGTAPPSGPKIARLSLDGNSGAVTLGMRVNRGAEATTGFTGYTAASSADLLAFSGPFDGNGKLASLAIINRYIADGSTEDDRIMTALESRFGL